MCTCKQVFHLSSLPLVLVKTLFSTPSIPSISGKLVCTTYRLVFQPHVLSNSLEVNLGTQWSYLLNLWDIPLALIDSITRSSLTDREKTQLAQDRKQDESQSGASSRTLRQRRFNSHRHNEGFVLRVSHSTEY